MSDTMSTEQLQPGKNPAEIGAGETPFLGSGAAVGAAALERLKAEGVEFVESETKMGGGDVDPVEKYFTENLAALDEMGKYIEAQRREGKGDDYQVKLGKQPLCTLGEYQKIYKAIQDARAKGDRRAVEEIIREARQLAPSTPEPQPEQQPAPRAGDWRESLPEDQKKRIGKFEAQIAGFDTTQLQTLLNRIKQLQALTPVEGWQGKGIQEDDVGLVLRLIQEQLEKISEDGEAGDDFRKIVKIARITGWRPPPDELDPKIDLSAGGTNGT